MRRSSKGALAALVMCVLALITSGLSGGPLSGQVIDKSTGKPVADAIVVVYWRGNWTMIFGESRSGCYHVETARTNAEGRFHIERWAQAWSPHDLRFSSGDMTLKTFKPGYWTGYQDAIDSDIVKLSPFLESKASYFESILGSPGWACTYGGESKRNQFRLLRALADEAWSLADTPDQIILASMLEERSERALINYARPVGDIRGQPRNIDPRDAYEREALK